MMFFLLATIFVVSHDPQGDIPLRYEGMSKNDITILQRNPFDFVNEAAYLQAVETKLTKERNDRDALKRLIQSDLAEVNTSTNTVDQRFRSLLNLLAHKGVI